MPITDIADLPALPMQALVTADRYVRSPAPAADTAARGWTELTTDTDLQL